jgi:hypothetical protein
MVMVLLFLGVIFLLVGFQAMGSSGNSGDDDSAVPLTTGSPSTTSSAGPPISSAPPAVKADVRVYNISGHEGVAGRTADQLEVGGYNIIEVGNLTLPDVATTTVYYGNTPGEHATANAVGKLLDAPVEPRTPDVADQPPGVIVVVAG